LAAYKAAQRQYTMLSDVRHGPAVVTIVVPFYNEGEGVAAFYQSLCPALEAVPNTRFEIVCVDDGSQDDTLRRLVAIARKDPRFVVIELSRNFGKEAALTAGMEASRGDAVVPLDADLQDPPSLIEQMVAEWRKGADVVLARRTDRSADSLLKRKTAEAFYRIHNSLSDVKVPENVGDFRLMDRRVVDALERLPERQRFMKGLFAWVGYRAVTLDYSRGVRAVGKSKFSGWKLWNFALEGITSFSTAPLKIWTYIGGAGAIAAVVYACVIVIRTMLFGVDVPGYASMLVLILFFGSLQLVSVGLLGEYIGRVYLETKQRPIYLVRRSYRAGDDSQPDTGEDAR
jgi:glycosyltransferase involved in cell wall biosynthesis